jgi:hypothetical protein
MNDSPSKKEETNNELSPPTITISLDYYLGMACRGIEEIATVSKEFGEYIQSKVDPAEQFCHVEFNEQGTLAQVYRIAAWRTCLRRDAEKKRQAEVSRQVRFALEEEQKKIQLKIQRRRDILQETIADVRKLHGPDVHIRLAKGTVNQGAQAYEFFVSLVFKALIGEHPKAASKFQIPPEVIKEFSSLPRDPEFKNKFITGVSTTEEI